MGRNKIETEVRRELAAVIGVNEKDIDLSTELASEQYVDSLDMLELSSRLEASLRVSIDVKEWHKFSRLEQLVDRLVELTATK